MFKTLAQVWQAIDKGQTLIWCHDSYEVMVWNDPVPQKDLFSHRDGKMLRVTCVSNDFGSRLTQADISCLKVK